MSMIGLTILWGVAFASLFALHTSSRYPVIQIIYVSVVVVQLSFLILVTMKRNASPIVLKRWLKFYIFLMVLLTAYMWIPALLNGDGRWSGPDHVRYYEKKYDAEVANALGAASVMIFLLQIIIGIAMSGFIKLFTKFRFNKFDERVNSVVAYVLFCPSPLKGFPGRFVYSLKGSKDLGDDMAFIRQEQGDYHFKRGCFRGPKEELVISKEEGMDEGVYACKVVGSDQGDYQVMALYEEKPGQWRLFELEEIEELKPVEAE
ncbi:hypothetical protein NSQ26_04495 [Bacillus sp. FSL W7-1360]